MAVSALARRLGVAPSTLRTWDRRYGIGPSAHAHGSHRRYTPRDVARLECMQQALDEGASPAEAARYAINAIATYSSNSEPTSSPQILGDNSVNEGKTNSSHFSATISVLEDAEPAVRNLSRALIARDIVTIRRIVSRAAAERGLPAVWETVLVPVLDWANEGRNSDAAAVNCRAFVECVTGMLSTMTLDAPIAVGGRVLLVDVPTGLDFRRPSIAHDLGFRALGAALATASVDVRTSRPVGRTALLASVTNAEPDVIVLWLPAGDCDVASLSRAIRRRRSGLALLAAGPGAAAAHLPRSVKSVGNLGDAVDAVTALI